MDSAAYTKGEWYVLGEDELSGIEFIEIASGDFGPGYRSISWVGNQPGGISDEDRANANLIAAAPDLLTICKRILDHPIVRLTGDVEPQLIAAIAKAEGRS